MANDLRSRSMTSHRPETLQSTLRRVLEMPLKRETHRIAGALFWRGPVLTLQPMRNLHMVTTVYRALTLLLAMPL